NDVLRGIRPIRKLFSSEQRSLYKEHAPKDLDLDSLTPLGPINVAKLKFPLEMLSGRVVLAEVWFYPDSSRFLELSTRCSNESAFEVLMETRSLLKDHGVSLTGEQHTMTLKALEYFSRLNTRKQRSQKTGL